MTTAPSSPPRWNRDTKTLVTVIALVVGVALVYLARSVISLVALAAVIAYIFQPLAGWFERRGKGRGLAALLVVLLLILLLAIGPALLTPSLVRSVEAVINILQRLPDTLQQWVGTLSENRTILRFAGFELRLDELMQQVNDSLSQALTEFKLPQVNELIASLMTGMRTAGGVVQLAFGFASKVVSLAFYLLFLLVLTFFLTKDGNQFGPSLGRLMLPAYQPEMTDLGRRLDQVWKSFFRGQLLLAGIIGTVVTIATTILGMQGALVLGILAGVMEVIPNLGPVLSMIPAVLVALVQGPPAWLHVSNLIFALIVVGVYFAIQQLENNILVPRIMGRSLNLHPLIVLLGVVVGASFAGVLGAFLSGPVLASLKVLGLYAHAKITDQDPLEHLINAESQEEKKPGKAQQLTRRLWQRLQHSAKRLVGQTLPKDSA